MSDVPPESRPVLPPEPDPNPTRVIPPDQGQATPKPRFVDRLWSLRAVIAVGLASVIVGGLGGAALANAGDRHDDRRGGPFRGPGQMQPRGPMGPPGTQQWHWNDGPRRHGMGQRQWDQGGQPGLIPPGNGPTPSPPPTPKN